MPERTIRERLEVMGELGKTGEAAGAQAGLRQPGAAIERLRVFSLPLPLANPRTVLVRKQRGLETLQCVFFLIEPTL